MSLATYTLPVGHRLIVQSTSPAYGTVEQTQPTALASISVPVSGSYLAGPFNDVRVFEIYSTVGTLAVSITPAPYAWRRRVDVLTTGTIADSDDTCVTYRNKNALANVETTIHPAIAGRSCRFVCDNTTYNWDILPDDPIIWPDVGGAATTVSKLMASGGSFGAVELECVDDGTWIVVSNLGWDFDT